MRRNKQMRFILGCMSYRRRVKRVLVSSVASIAACGAAVKPPPDRQVVLADAVNDEAKLASMLRGSVTNGGLWFEDAACAAKFQAPGEIKEDQLAAFAHCLAGLKLQRSTREDALGDVVVMTYAPGFEVEARVVNENSGARLTWIGFESLRPGDVFPTVTTGALEALRVAGTADGPVDKDLSAVLRRDPTPSSSAEYTWFKLCIDETGTVESVLPLRSTGFASYDRRLLGAMMQWQYSPYMADAEPVPVCTGVTFIYTQR
jgi:hypothetical protein